MHRRHVEDVGASLVRSGYIFRPSAPPGPVSDVSITCRHLRFSICGLQGASHEYDLYSAPIDGELVFTKPSVLQEGEELVVRVLATLG